MENEVPKSLNWLPKPEEQPAEPQLHSRAGLPSEGSSSPDSSPLTAQGTKSLATGDPQDGVVCKHHGTESECVRGCGRERDVPRWPRRPRPLSGRSAAGGGGAGTAPCRLLCGRAASAPSRPQHVFLHLAFTFLAPKSRCSDIPSESTAPWDPPRWGCPGHQPLWH